MRFLARGVTFFSLIFFFQLVLFASVFACKYTVRDIGFTDLGATEYKLYFYVDKTIPKEMISTFDQLTFASFLDANVEREIIHIDRQTDHPAMNYLKQQKTRSLPALFLFPSEMFSSVQTSPNVGELQEGLCIKIVALCMPPSR